MTKHIQKIIYYRHLFVTSGFKIEVMLSLVQPGTSHTVADRIWLFYYIPEV